MIKEEKDLLLKDLCARLPYGVICDLSYKGTTITEKLKFCGTEHLINGSMDIKPYLRSMSSMTEEEKEERFYYVTGDAMVAVEDTGGYVDWLNEHHFDYRGLIEKGLALEAPKGMYKEDK